MDMRLQMTMKRPVVFSCPGTDELPCMAGTMQAEDRWQVCAQMMLDSNEPCMEMSESPAEIIRAMKRAHTSLKAYAETPCSYRIAGAGAELRLVQDGDGSIFLVFSEGRKGVDITDFGPADAALFIRAVFGCHSAIAMQ